MTPSIVSVNVGAIREIEWFGRVVRTAIWKDPVDGPVRVEGVQMVGDAQADLRVHGGDTKAVYAYASEDYAWWSSQRGGEPLGPGTFGENLTTAGIDLRDVIAGERWRIGDALLEVTMRREPCFKLGIRMGTASFVAAFEEAGRYGTYLRIIEPGFIQAGDEIKPSYG